MKNTNYIVNVVTENCTLNSLSLQEIRNKIYNWKMSFFFSETKRKEKLINARDEVNCDVKIKNGEKKKLRKYAWKNWKDKQKLSPF